MSRAPDNAQPISPLFASICNDGTRGRLQRRCLHGAWAKSLLHAIIHGMDVTAVGGELDALTEIQPAVVGAASSNSLNIAPGLPECSECLLRRFLFVAEQSFTLGCYSWLKFSNSHCEPVWVLLFSLAKGVHGGVVDGITDVAPSLFSAGCGAVPEGLFDGVSDLLTQVWKCCLGSVEAWASFLLRTVNSFGL